MSTRVPLLSREQIDQLPERAREVVEYRKSGLSLNHIQGCPLDCAYCIRHTYGLWDQRQPRALMTDTEAVDELVNHRYFQPHVTPVQVFNRATDPFLPTVRPHTFAVLEALDARALRNHVLVITRHSMKPEDIDRLNQFRHVKVTLLFTYSGIDNKDVEPYPSHVAVESLKLMSAPQHRQYRTILYWRPLVPGLNDTEEHLHQAHALAWHADATVFTGLFYRDQIAAYYKTNSLPEPYDETTRRKIVPERLERRVLEAFSSATPLFRKTSCAVSYVHGLSDYNGHYGIRELCDICPLSQLELCASEYRVPSPDRIREAARTMPADMVEPTSDGKTGIRMADWMSLTYVVVDVEGNGQQPPDLVELAAVPIVGGTIEEPVSWLVKPELPIKHFATRIHGLTNKDVADAPVFAAVRDDVLAALSSGALVAHNAHIDVEVLSRTLGDWQCPEVFDTLKLARRLLPNRESYRLGALVEAFALTEGLPDGLTPHRATYDALVTARLLVRLATLPGARPLSLEELRGGSPGGGEDEAPVLF